LTLSAAAVSSSALVHRAVGRPVSVAVELPPSSSSGALSGVGLASPASSACPSPLSNIQALLKREGKLVLSMVGLPARGKTFMARRLKRHLSWMGYRVEIFNVGNYRRKTAGAKQEHGFFDPANPDGEQKRAAAATLALDDMITQLLSDTLDIGIFDATNTTVRRRQWLISSLAAADPSFRVVFVELVCSDEAIIRSNVRDTKLKSPDYAGVPEDEAVRDFLARIDHYASIYEPLGDSPLEADTAYIKLIDVGRTMIAHRINGFLNSRIMFFCSNLHITPRPIWFTRHGESEFNVQGRIGGDSGLSPRGLAYAHRLAAFFNQLYPRGAAELVVWTSTLRRTHMTAAPLGREIVAWKALDEIDAGVCDGLTYEAIAATMPDEYAARAKNKFGYRYPRGESYQDMVQRLEPVLIELMRQRTPVLIVSHQATLRVLYAYLTDKQPESCPDVLMPLHTVIQLTQEAYGAQEIRHELLAPSGGGAGGH
jgi:broad specificity phosphatase PhoE